jgi:hypothetical protein
MSTFCNSDTSRVRCFTIIGQGMDFERIISMKKHKTKPIDLNNQVHSEFETSVGNDFNVVRGEIARKKKEMDVEGPLNQLPEDEDSVKNESSTEEEAPKMNAEEKS